MSPLDPPVSGGKIIGTPYQGSHAPGAGGVAANWESDNAWDISVPVGTPVYAVADGTIGPEFGGFNSGNPALQGLRLHLNTASMGSAYYAHLSSYAAGIKPGASVKAGQLLGYSGEANGVAHLHFAVTPGSKLASALANLPGAVADTTAAATQQITSSLPGGCASAAGVIVLTVGLPLAYIAHVVIG